MRFIVYGVGAVGGTIAARLVLSGKDVLGIARGRMLEAITANGGLRLLTTTDDSVATLACYADPAEMELRADDAILLTVKSQDTEAALARLRAAGAYQQPIICAQNGVNNERAALRYFPNVYGMAAMLPSQYETPGVVEAFGEPKFGLFDIGRYPEGADDVCHAASDALNQAGFDCEVLEDVMANKYAKLLLNVGNIVDAALGSRARFGPWYEAARQEAKMVFQAMGIAFGNVDFDSPRRKMMQTGTIPGAERKGSSSQQSLLRHTGSLETDYLNGEIVLMGRLSGFATPVNAAMCRIADRMLRDEIAPGEFPEDEVDRMVADS